METFNNNWNEAIATAARHLGAPENELVTPHTLEGLTRGCLRCGDVQILFLSGPTAAGKSVIQRGLQKMGIRRCLNVYTRPLRPDERAGVDVILMTEAEFSTAEADDKFLFTSTRHGSRHGILRSTVEGMLRSSEPIMMERSPRSLVKLLAHPLFGNGVRHQSIFILPPSPSVLVERLEARRRKYGPDDSEPAERLHWALEEFPRTGKPYDAFLVNDDLERVVDVLRSLFP